MMTKIIHVSLNGPDLQRLLVSAHDSQAFASDAPKTLSVDDKTMPPSRDWIERWTARCRRNVFAAWDDNYDLFLDFSKGMVVKASFPSASATETTNILSWLAALPFTLASIGSIHSEWSDRADFPVSGFSDLHFPFGWACAFRGEGHQRLVSRRWLEFGPWRLIRGGNDTSFVQFHDFDADPDTAFTQARPGHKRMGISDIGGFIQSNYVYTYPLHGLYSREDYRLRIPVSGRAVSQLEMLDACAARYYRALGTEHALKSIAYVFANEDEARAHLHELWLRELECWTFINGHEVRLDLDYRPSPEKPAWVQQLDESESASNERSLETE